MLTASWSLQRADHGEQPYWALVLLAACLGQIGLPGGGFGFGYGSSAQHRRAAARVSRPGDADIAANPARLAIPAARITDCLLHPGERYDYDGKSATYPDIKLVYWAGGNPFHHHQDLNRLRRAWQRPETIVVHEPWWTATARHADIVLPATTSLERNDIGWPPRDRFVIAMHKAIEPVGEARDDFAIFRDLARRLGCEAAFTEGRDEARVAAAPLRRLPRGARRAIAVPGFRRVLGKGWVEIPRAGRGIRAVRGVPRRSRQAQAAHAVGPDRALFRAHRRLRLRRLPAASDLDRAGRMAGRARRRHAFRCISCRASRATSCTARWMRAGQRAEARSPGARRWRSTRPMPRARGIADGDVVRVFNDRGACFCRRGRHRRGAAGRGAGSPAAPGTIRRAMRTDAACAHGNANVLTRDHGTSRLGQGPSSATALVEVERCTARPPSPRSCRRCRASREGRRCSDEPYSAAIATRRRDRQPSRLHRPAPNAVT